MSSPLPCQPSPSQHSLPPLVPSSKSRNQEDSEAIATDVDNHRQGGKEDSRINLEGVALGTLGTVAERASKDGRGIVGGGGGGGGGGRGDSSGIWLGEGLRLVDPPRLSTWPSRTRTKTKTRGGGEGGGGGGGTGTGTKTKTLPQSSCSKHHLVCRHSERHRDKSGSSSSLDMDRWDRDGEDRGKAMSMSCMTCLLDAYPRCPAATLTPLPAPTAPTAPTTGGGRRLLSN